MGLILGVVAIAAGILFLALALASLAVAVDEGDWLLACIAACFLLMAVTMVPAARTGFRNYDGQWCSGLSKVNPELEMEIIDINYWSWDCYVTTDGVTVPWERYRAVVEG